MVLSLAIFNNLVLTMSNQIGKTLAKRRMQKLENLHYYVLSTLFPLPVDHDRIPSTTPGAEPPRDAKDSGSARSHPTHLETSSSYQP